MTQISGLAKKFITFIQFGFTGNSLKPSKYDIIISFKATMFHDLNLTQILSFNYNVYRSTIMCSGELGT